jgi:hypothetical protein
MKQSQVHALVDFTIEQNFSGILDHLNEPNFCGSTFASASICYASSPSTTVDANLSTTIIIDKTL